MKRIIGTLKQHYLVAAAVIAILATLIIETAARQTVYGGVVFMVTHPLVFLFNAMIIFGCMSIAYLFRHRAFVAGFIAAIWLVLGIVNGIILSHRMTPFTTNDLTEVKDGLTLISNYMNKGQVVLLIVAAAIVVFLIILAFRLAPVRKEKVNYKKAIPAVLLIVACSFGVFLGGVKVGLVDSYFPNLAYGYRDNGFNYCFLSTWLNKGIRKPRDYSEKKVADIFTKKELETTVGNVKTDGSEKHPNIIFLQLESMVDPEIAKDIKLNKDCMPHFHELQKNYSHGKIQVPAMGAGTANTEFENMTGMRIRFFGPGEYPYKTVLRDKTIETIPFNLKNIGYSTHAIHNHRAVFYGRNTVFPNMGFDTFTSIEYMSNISKTPKNWARDNILTNEIMTTLESTKNPDYIYTISVQGHGSYPSEQVIDDPEIKVTEAPNDKVKWQWEYYANQVYEMDNFIEDLTTELSSYKEDTIVVMYGDHLPAIENLTQENLVGNRNIYQTDYVIWSNFKMDKKTEDLYAYQMGAEVLNRVGIHNGTMVTYQQNHKNDKNYLKNMRTLQYDMLYGDNYIYKASGTKTFKATDMKMGVKPIKIQEIVKIGSKYYIKGQNFTEYSKVSLDGEVLKTEYLGPTLLGLKEKVDPSDVKKMKISQIDKKDNEILSTTE